jgi:hypothetical protein
MKKFLRTLGWAAAAGALTAVAADGITPMFEGKPKAVAQVAVVGALSSVVTLLKRSPLQDQDDAGTPPPAQEPPAK